MQIILIPDRLAKTKTISISVGHLALAALGGAFTLVALTMALYWATLRLAVEFKVPVLHQVVQAVHQAEAERGREFVQQNLNAMAVKLGEMQAQLTRLDALGERLSSLAGFKPQDFRFGEAPGMGGAASTSLPPQNLSLRGFGDRLSELARGVETRSDMLGVLEAQLFEQAIKRKLMPTMMPVNARFNASGFGMRLDPITGQQSMHEGIDFIADTGTPIVAAASGVVQFAGFHPQYGNMIDIDHGNDLVTRYAHASRLLVQEGDVVQRGRRIAEIGSTGRSTGPHLHFEVRYKGSAQNPMQFLLAGNSQPEEPAKVAKAARRTTPP